MLQVLDCRIRHYDCNPTNGWLLGTCPNVLPPSLSGEAWEYHSIFYCRIGWKNGPGFICGVCSGSGKVLRHQGRNKMSDSLHTTLWKTLPWIRIDVFWLTYHWSLLLSVYLGSGLSKKSVLDPGKSLAPKTLQAIIHEPVMVRFPYACTCNARAQKLTLNITAVNKLCSKRFNMCQHGILKQSASPLTEPFVEKALSTTDYIINGQKRIAKMALSLGFG